MPTYTDKTLGHWIPCVETHICHWDLPPGIMLKMRTPQHYEHPATPGANPYGYDLEITGFPGDWDLRVDTQEDPLTKDKEIIRELMEAVTEDHYQRIDEGMEQIEGELNWIAPLVVAPRGGGCWFFLDEDPGITRLDGDIIMKPRCNWVIEDALTQFEEDWEYEKWTNSQQYIKSLKEYNRHTLLSLPPHRRSASKYVTGWTGGKVNDLGKSINWMLSQWTLPDSPKMIQQGQVGCISVEDRYDVDVEIVTHHPEDKKGYAKGTTPYGDVYIPFKFRKYLPDIGDTTKMTIALQDVCGGKKANGFRWTAIYQHNPTPAF